MRKLDLSKPPESDRIIGFTIPNGGSFYICDHDEVWKVSVGRRLGIETTLARTRGAGMSAILPVFEHEWT
jgi:hypothetical protein